MEDPWKIEDLNPITCIHKLKLYHLTCVVTQGGKWITKPFSVPVFVPELQELVHSVVGSEHTKGLF